MTENENNTTNIALAWNNNNPVLVQRGIDESMWNALKTSVFPGAADNSVLMAVDYCRSRQLDIMMKPVHIVPMYITDKQTSEKGMRDVIMPGVGLYRIQAERSGNYAGIDAPIFGPIQNVTIDGVTVAYPEFCTITMYKLLPNGDRVAYSATEYWIENYATKSRDSKAPNAMWTKRPRAQLVKCTEAQVLRRGWPEIGQDVTLEEMEGKEFASMKTVNDAPASSIVESTQSEITNELTKPVRDEQIKMWCDAVSSGTKDYQSMIDFIDSKGFTLTAMQTEALNAVKPVIEGEA